MHDHTPPETQKLSNRQTLLISGCSVLALLLVFSFPAILSMALGSFNNSLASENLTFVGSSNFTRYLEIPLTANITGLFINFTSLTNASTATFPNNTFLEIGDRDGVYEWSLVNISLQGINGYLIEDNRSQKNLNLLFERTQNKSFSFYLPKFANVAGATFNLSGGENILERNSFEITNQSWVLETSTRQATGWSSDGTVSLNATAAGAEFYRDDINVSLYKYLFYDSSLNVTSNYGFTVRVCNNGTDAFDGSCVNIGSINGISQTNNSVLNLLNGGTGIKRVNFRSNSACIGGGCSSQYFSFAYFDNIRFAATENLSFPNNTYVEVGTPDGSHEWNTNNVFNTTANVTTNLGTSINTFLATCTNNSQNYCHVPILIHSDTSGIINITDIRVNMTNVSRTLNLTAKVNALINDTRCTQGIVAGRNCSLPFFFSSATSGILQYLAINVSYITIPNITLSSPANNTAAGGNQTMTCNVTDDTMLSNITMLVYNSSTLYNSTTVHVTGRTNFTTQNINFSRSDTYRWNCIGSNNESIARAHPVNYSLVVDITNPVTNLLAPANNEWLAYNQNVAFNCSTSSTNLDTQFLFGTFNGSYSQNRTNNTFVSGAAVSYYGSSGMFRGFFIG